MAPRQRASRHRQGKPSLRIIGGRWRGRKLGVVDAAGLRPTPDRIRETLFNWLAVHCRGARVLDCFAGSGVLGLEALSRGAHSVVSLEKNPQALATLRADVKRLECSEVDIIAGDALQSINQLHRAFDIVFIDPPYAQPGLRQQAFERLEAGGCINTNARIYFEWPSDELFELPAPTLSLLKQKSAGRVNYAIAEWQGSR